MFNTNAQCYQNISQVLLTSAFILWPTCTRGFGIREKIRCGLWFFGVFLCGFAVFGPPLRPPLYMMMDYFISWLFEGAFHVDKIHMWFKIANIMHALPVLVLWQTDFTPKWVVVLYLHETIARFRTGVKFSLWHNNRGELTQGWLVPGWHFVVVSCKQM